MPLKIKHRFRHDCDLPPESTTFQITTPYDNWYQHLWHRFRDHMSVQRNTESKRYFRSHSTYVKEKKRHLRNPKYRYIIHPFSNFIQIKEMCYCVVWLITYVLETYLGVFLTTSAKRSQHNHPEKILLVMNIIIFFDIIVRFCTGYAIDRTREVVLAPKKIMYKYLRTYFFFDFGAVLSYGFYYSVEMSWSRNMELFIYELQKLRLARVGSFLDGTDRAFRYFGFHKVQRILIMIFLKALIILHTLTCLSAEIYAIMKMYDVSDADTWIRHYYINQRMTTDVESDRIHKTFFFYVLHLSVTVSHFFGVGRHSYITNDRVEMFFLGIVLVLGMSFTIYCFSRIMDTFTIINIADEEYEEMLAKLDQYMNEMEFKKDLKKRIRTYFEYKFDKKYFSESVIMDSLSEHLRMEVLLYGCQNLIRTVQIFRGLPKAAVGSILALMKQEIYLTDDRIFKVGETEDIICFILYGTCKISEERGHEVMHIEDGDYFGFTPALQRAADRNVYSVEALEVTEIYILEYKDFLYCCRNYPEIMQKLENMIAVTHKQYQEMLALKTMAEHQTDDIIYELRQGRILRHGIRRLEFG